MNAAQVISEAIRTPLVKCVPMSQKEIARLMRKRAKPGPVEKVHQIDGRNMTAREAAEYWGLKSTATEDRIRMMNQSAARSRLYTLCGHKKSALVRENA